MSQQHTKCPSCGAVYPLPSEKLGNPHAKAKCGRCQQIFLLNDNLLQKSSLPKPAPISAEPKPANTRLMTHESVMETDTPSAPVTAPVQPEPKAPPLPKSATLEDDFERFLDEQIELATTNIQREDSTSNAQDKAWIEDALKNSDPDMVAINQKNNTHANPKADIDLSTLITPASNLGQKRTPSFKKALSHKPTTQQLTTKKSLASQLMWFIGCVILLALMVVQYTLFNLETLITNPSHASKIQSFCALAKCSTPSADLSSLNITATLTPNNGSTNILITINNRSSEEQLYPDLLVRLKNAEGAVVGDFVARRSDYLAESQKSILGNQQKHIMLTALPKQTPTVVEVTPLYQSP